MQKRILIIQDISAIGRVSMSAALPILSCSGLITTMLPTALLSTHSGGFKDFTFLDLTEEMGKITDHWAREGIEFDAVQTGYLGSAGQVKEVEKALGLAKKDALVIIDPVMGDKGRLYSGITEEMIKAMRSLCMKADIIMPNLTEAAFLLGRPYEDKDSDKDYILELARGLYREFQNENIVITGVSSMDGLCGSASYNGKKDTIAYSEKPRIKGHYYGTGDIFASVFTAAVLRGKSMEAAADLAAEFTYRTIKQSHDQGLPQRLGVCFELNIPWLVKMLEE